MEKLEIIAQTREKIRELTVNGVIDDLNFYISSVKAQTYIQPKIAEWYNNGGKSDENYR